MDSAIGTVLENIDTLQTGVEDVLVMPLTTLNKATAEIYEKNAKTVSLITSKLLKAADKAATKNLDILDGVYTGALAALDMWQFDVNFLLHQLSSKCGFTKVGEPLEAALEQELATGPKLDYGPTMVLSIKECIPFAEDLLRVLREIRDRLPPLPVGVEGEVSDTEPEVQVPPDITQWPVPPSFIA